MFAGTPEFSVPALQALIDSRHEVIAVFTQPDRPAGRGRKLTPSPVKARAQTHHIAVHQPQSLRQPEVQQLLSDLAPDVMVVVAYGLLLPVEVLSLPPLGCVNIHGSLLPRWRGAAPIHRAILAGDTTTGITIMQMDKGLDTGPMLSSKPVTIDQQTSTAQLHDRLAEVGAELLLDTLSGWCEGSIQAMPQDDSLATYADKLTKHEAVIDWRRSAVEIDRQVRAFNPWPVAETQLHHERLRVWGASVAGETSTRTKATPGTVLRCQRDGLLVQCGDGMLSIEELQLPGKRAMSISDFANANDITGVTLGEAGGQKGGQAGGQTSD